MFPSYVYALAIYAAGMLGALGWVLVRHRQVPEAMQRALARSDLEDTRTVRAALLAVVALLWPFFPLMFSMAARMEDDE